MPENTEGTTRRHRKRSFHRFTRAILSRRKRRDGDWFAHPEVQARVAEAEADIRRGRVYRISSPAEAKALLDSWK